MIVENKGGVMKIIKRLINLAPEMRFCVYISILLSIATAGLIIYPYFYFWRYLQALLVRQNLSNTMELALSILILTLIYVLTYFGSLVASHFLALRIERRMKEKGLHHLLRASFTFFDLNTSGRIRKIIDDNSGNTHMAVAHMIPDVTIAILVPIGLLVSTFIINVKLGVLLLITLIICLIQFYGMMGNKNFMKKYMAALEKLNGETVEYVRGIPVVKIFQTEIVSMKALYQCILDYSKLAFDYTLSCRVPYVSFQVVANLFTALAIPLAIVAINGGESIGEAISLVLFFACFGGLLFTYMMKIMFASMYKTQATDALDKLEGLIEDMDQEKFKYGTIDKFTNGDIVFKDVSFAYDHEEGYVLEDLSFSLPKGRTYALVGSSGSGKSTIAKLMSGFYVLDKGEIYIGKTPLTDYSLKCLQENIAFVFQNAKLFNSTIYDNVAIGKKGATEEEVMKALELARCGDILEKFPDGVKTVIGSKGVYLSGGEKQRIAIARAILKDADIVILDEASAAADPENEYEIQQAFTNLMKGKTVIMIAHRLSSIRNVDEILVIESGDIIERGSDAELMGENGKYAKLQGLYNQANEWRVA